MGGALHPSQKNRQAPATRLRSTNRLVVELRGGGGNGILLDGIGATLGSTTTPEEYSAFIEGAYSWCCNLGAPSALVAGAVVATLYENMHSGDLDVFEMDSPWVQLGKKINRLLLLSAFMMETLSIFVTTVTGTMLLSRTTDQMTMSDISIASPLEFLKVHFEFEFLTARIMFLQGLLNWLAAIGLGHLLPSSTGDPDTPGEAALNKFIACSMWTLVILMISFYNTHSTFYTNYWTMLARWVCVMMQGHVFGIGSWPPQALSLVLIPSMVTCCYWGYLALWPSPATRIQKPTERILTRRNNKPRWFHKRDSKT